MRFSQQLSTVSRGVSRCGGETGCAHARESVRRRGCLASSSTRNSVLSRPTAKILASPFEIYRQYRGRRRAVTDGVSILRQVYANSHYGSAWKKLDQKTRACGKSRVLVIPYCGAFNIHERGGNVSHDASRAALFFLIINFSFLLNWFRIVETFDFFF